MRIEWADISRAIGLLAIMLLAVSSLFTTGVPEHVPPTLDPSIIAKIAFSPSDPLSSYASLLGSFAYPLIFLCIGYTMRQQKLSAGLVFDTVGKYLVPYILFGGIACIVASALDPDHDILPWLFALIYGNGGERGDMMMNAPLDGVFLPVLWLMPAIMFAKLFSFLLSKLPLLTRIFVSGAVFLLSTASAGHIFLPLDIQPALCAAWFMTCGGILRETHAFSAWGWEKILFGICLTFGIAYAALVSLGFMTVPDYAVANYRNGIVDMLGGVCIGASFMLLSQVISLWGGVTRKLLCWAGENFLAILSVFAVVLCAVSGMPWIVEGVAVTIGTIPTLIVFSVTIIAFSILGALAISKIPLVRSIFEHFAPKTSKRENNQIGLP